MKVPRKKKKKIPAGHYCYTPVEFPGGDNGWRMRIKRCPFYKHTEDIEGHCRLLDSVIDDQVKDCGINKRSYKFSKKQRKRLYKHCKPLR